jgi:hypothetical protein
VARVIWCRVCYEPYESIAGLLPPQCPACQKPAVWTTVRPDPTTPTVAYATSENDRKFLRSLRILPD